MRTQKQIEASRANGAKSKGPVTPEGKQRCAQNATTHGFRARTIVLSNEDREAYQQLLADYITEWQPQNRLEDDLVHDIVSARWRLDRAMLFETSAIDFHIDRQRGEEERSVDETTRAMLAFARIVESGRVLSFLSGHEARLRRVVDRATQRLMNLRKEPKACSAKN